MLAREWLEGIDDLGPARVALLHDALTGLRAIVVVDNVACGPAIGGVRMSPDVTLDEIWRLARAMTLKNAAAGLPHGGAKAGILADPHAPELTRERLVRAFGRLVAGLVDYIPGPDMGTDERAMAWLLDEMGRCTGLPRVLGGIPLDQIGATARGLVAAAEVAQDLAGIRLDEARVVIQGFGAVGAHAARLFASRGARIVAVSDSRGGVAAPAGLDVSELLRHKRERGLPVREFPGGRAISHEALVGVDCELWIPAARPDVITEASCGQLRARLVVPGANIAVTAGAERALHARGVWVVPDFIANAGGVICAATEFAGGTEATVMDIIAEKVAANTAAVLGAASERGILPRQAAHEVATRRVREAMSFRRRGLAPLQA